MNVDLLQPLSRAEKDIEREQERGVQVQVRSVIETRGGEDEVDFSGKCRRIRKDRKMGGFSLVQPGKSFAAVGLHLALNRGT